MSLRTVYGGTVRRNHLKLNREWSFVLTVVVTIPLLDFDYQLPYELPKILLYLIPLFCRLQEVWATCDRDSEELRKGISWWSPYGRFTKHRSYWSHSLFPGTLIRFIYGYPFLLLLIPGVQSQFIGLEIALAIVVFALIGAAIADVGHMLLDEFNLIQILIGHRQ